MLKAIQYTLAAICLAASVGCLALWWRSMAYMNEVSGPTGTTHAAYVMAFRGVGIFRLRNFPLVDSIGWEIRSTPLDPTVEANAPNSYFGTERGSIYFPLRYPALAFALAAVAAIRIRRFTPQSALVGMSVVARWLGMVVAF